MTYRDLVYSYLVEDADMSDVFEIIEQVTGDTIDYMNSFLESNCNSYQDAVRFFMDEVYNDNVDIRDEYLIWTNGQYASSDSFSDFFDAYWSEYSDGMVEYCDRQGIVEPQSEDVEEDYSAARLEDKSYE